MRVTSLEINNYRAFMHVGPLELGRINVLIGPNNGGKSSLIHALYLMQEGSEFRPSDVRIGSGANVATINIGLSELSDNPVWWNPNIGYASMTLSIQLSGNLVLNVSWGPNASGSVIRLPAQEPNHFVVPYFSRRKAVVYDEDVRRQNALAVEASFQHLAARLSRLGNSAFPAHEKYACSCEEILGFVVTAIPSVGGQEPGVFVSRDESIPIQAMGEGVPNIVGLLADLALFANKLFLIEEVENDLHENDGLHWPRRDGLKWPRLASVVCWC